MPILPDDAIFISYSRRDDETMRKITFFLRDQGFKVWVDNEKLIPGTPAWEGAIENAIKKAFAVIVILSPDSKSSEWVRREITYADQFDKRVFPVLIKGDEDDSLPIRLVTRQYVDLRTDEEAGLNSLSAAINFYINEKQTLEMKRPLVSKGSVSDLNPPPAPPQLKNAKSPVKWMLPAGILMLLCVLGVGAIWAGYRLYSRSIPVTGTDSIGPPLVDAPADVIVNTPMAGTPTDAPVAVDPDVPVPDILPQYLNDVQITQTNTFDDPSGNGWEVQAGKIENGAMEINGNKNNDGAWFNKEFVEGNAILMDFHFTERSTFLVYLNFGSFETDSFRRFGMFVENGSPITDLYNGTEYFWGGYSGNLAMEPEKTYTILLAILPNGEILDVVWDPADTGSVLEYRNKFGETWAGLPWTLVIQASKGTIYFDNFREIKFSGVK